VRHRIAATSASHWRLSPAEKRVVVDDVRYTGQCTVHFLVNFINKIPEHSALSRTPHWIDSPDSPMGPRLA
jgi:hypothetical protein